MRFSRCLYLLMWDRFRGISPCLSDGRYSFSFQSFNLKLESGLRSEALKSISR